MKRIYSDYAYSDAPRAQCWWDETCEPIDRPALKGSHHCDVAIVGGGYTGVSAALHLAQAGVSAMVLESRFVGWGASGRNGGFCCLGGGMLDDASLDRDFGRDGRNAWRQTEAAAVQFVDDLITKYHMEVDRHSKGETQLAHRPHDYEAMQLSAAKYAENYGVTAKLTAKPDLEAEGMNAGFYGALTVPIGFGLNPQKYLKGVANVAENAGARIYHNSPVVRIERNGSRFKITAPQGNLTADKVIIATNGYSSDDLPPWLAARYMPTQSSIIVTRPLTQAELDAQGWTSRQASYDTRHLLHYFRLMPDNRMLFGVRGGLMSNAGSEKRALKRARADFDRMFPAWQKVETPNAWSGMVCIARNRMPYVGEIPGTPDMFASLCYHGNGVAMASYSGALLADLVQEKEPTRPYPEAVKRSLSKFELGPFRRLLMPFAYAGFAISDRLMRS